MATAKDKALKLKEDTKLATGQLMEFDDNEGFEGEDHDSAAIPRLKILQKSSQEVDEDGGGYVKGAKAGMVINTVTSDLYNAKDDPIIVVPCYYEKVYIEWIPLEDGGGFVASFPAAEGNVLIETLEKDDRGIPHTEDGHEIRDTREHFMLIIRDGIFEPVVSSFTSTKIKKSKAWFTMMKMARLDGHPLRQPPMFAFSYELKTVIETKDQYTYYNWDIRKGVSVPELDPTGGLIRVAKAFKDAIVSGVKKAVPEQEGQQDAENNDF